MSLKEKPTPAISVDVATLDVNSGGLSGLLVSGQNLGILIVSMVNPSVKC